MPIAPELSAAESYAGQLQRFVATLTEVRDTKIVASLPDFPKQYLSRAQRLWNTFAIRAAKLEARVSGEAKARLWLPTSGLSQAQVVWKSVESVTRLGAIATALPGACGILLLRHPCGYVASVLRGQKQGCFTDSDCIGEDLGILAALTTTRIAQEYGNSVFKDPRKAAHGWRAELPQRLQRAVIRIAAHSRAGRLFL